MQEVSNPPPFLKGQLRPARQEVPFGGLGIASILAGARLLKKAGGKGMMHSLYLVNVDRNSFAKSKTLTYLL